MQSDAHGIVPGDAVVSAEGLFVKLGAAVVSRHAPSIWSWVLTRYRGVSLLVVGPGGSGKSSFLDYLNDGQLRPPNAPHVITSDIETHGHVTLDIGQAKRLVLRIKNAVEIPGQGNSARHHAQLIALRRPDSVIVMIDSSKQPSQSLSWLDSFLRRLSELANAGEFSFEKINSFIICVNKIDIVHPIGIEEYGKVIAECVKNNLSAVLGVRGVEKIPIMPSISVRTAQGDILASDILTIVARKAK